MRYLTAVAALGLLLTVTATAGATSVDTGDVYLQNHKSGALTYGYIKVYGDGHNGATGNGGIYQFTATDKSPDCIRSGEGQLVPDWGFCSDLPQEPAKGCYDVVRVQDVPLPHYGPMGAQKAAYIEQMWARYFDDAWLTSPSNTEKKKAEAFGATIWEIVYEPYQTDPGLYDVTTFQGTSPTAFKCDQCELASTANTWLHSLDDGTPYTAPALRGLTHDSGQDFIVELVPEPVTMAGLALGVGALGGYLRRRRK